MLVDEKTVLQGDLGNGVTSVTTWTVYLASGIVNSVTEPAPPLGSPGPGGYQPW